MLIFDFMLLWQVEIKNLNSFSSINRAIDFEISRQVHLHSQGQGDSIVQETRLWEEGSQVNTITIFFLVQPVTYIYTHIYAYSSPSIVTPYPFSV